ncbi:hypothetical protein CC86DRAFT_67174 [Ophiobolus disseminans]|uniref:Uncharacterized protein n=1 Tax=Ophiobolus disseminans TaxID=1469910 RepID=A0A6A6ZS39_9PLEO|nr:hypothetical protein CC86DRAFT_67174 [Ophiobolus disseminans]
MSPCKDAQHTQSLLTLPHSPDASRWCSTAAWATRRIALLARHTGCWRCATNGLSLNPFSGSGCTPVQQTPHSSITTPIQQLRFSSCRLQHLLRPLCPCCPNTALSNGPNRRPRSRPSACIPLPRRRKQEHPISFLGKEREIRNPCLLVWSLLRSLSFWRQHPANRARYRVLRPGHFPATGRCILVQRAVHLFTRAMIWPHCNEEALARRTDRKPTSGCLSWRLWNRVYHSATVWRLHSSHSDERSRGVSREVQIARTAGG